MSIQNLSWWSLSRDTTQSFLSAMKIAGDNTFNSRDDKSDVKLVVLSIWSIMGDRSMQISYMLGLLGKIQCSHQPVRDIQNFWLDHTSHLMKRHRYLLTNCWQTANAGSCITIKLSFNTHGLQSFLQVLYSVRLYLVSPGNELQILFLAQQTRLI